MKVYISGPISAKIEGTTAEQRKERFMLCEQWILLHTRMEPINPLKVQACPDHSCGGAANNLIQGVDDAHPDHSWECWMRHDIKALLDCQAIVLLPGWDQSPGATMECDIARTLGMIPYFADKTGRILL